MERNDCILSASQVTKQVDSGDKQLIILKDIELNITKGESLAILGTSGSGKTTLLSLLAGLDAPSSGKIYFKNQDINQLTEDERAKLRAKQIGFIFQSFQLIPTLTAIENIMLPLELQSKRNASHIAKTWLDKVGLGERLTHYPRQLSGGEQQRVAIARAFAIEPDILFADEPTGNLDKKSASNIINLLFRLNKDTKTTLVIVTHDDILAQRCQRQLHLNDGQLQ